MTYSRFPKLHTLTDIDTHLVLATCPNRGPTPDVAELGRLLHDLPDDLSPEVLYADAGYDSERNHRLCWQQLGVASIIPPTGRRSTKPAAGLHRRLMQHLFKAKPTAFGFGQRWQVETSNSMLKRNQGHATAAVSYHAQNRDLLLRCITHNAAILMMVKLFYRAVMTLFSRGRP